MLNRDGSDGFRRCWSLSVLTVASQSPEQEVSCVSTVVDPARRFTPPHKDFGVLVVPTWLRCDAGRQVGLRWWTQLGLGLCCTLSVANLYYCQPLLIEIANSLHASYSTVAWIPTMYSAGYCVGLFFISPLGDMVRRRQLIMTLVFITTCLSVGLALSRSLAAFCTLATLVGMFNVTPQILIPLAADLATPEHRSRVVSILQSSLMLGILLARVLSGVIGYFTTWHMVYYIAIGVQVIVLCGAYAVVPDHPPKNPRLTYSETLRTMVTYSITEPRLVQATLINFASIACWTNFWVTLTFLLGGQPYHFSTLYIGLFGLIGILGIFSGPLASHFIDRFGTWVSVLVATLFLLVLQCIEMAAGGIHIAVVIIVCFGIDAFRQTQTVSLQTIVLSISEEARSRLNAILTVSLFAGQVMGSSVGSHIFLHYGWRAAAGLSVALYGWQLLVLLVRGPQCGHHVWFGYGSGLSLRDQQRTKAGSHVESVGDWAETETETAAQASAETLVHASSCWPGKQA